jgi:Rieske Fe-S protein
MSEPKQAADPLWKEEVSFRAADERYVTRRQFGKFLVLTSVGMLAGNGWIVARRWWRGRPELPRVRVGRAGELPVGGVRLFTYPTADDPCLLIRPDEGTYVAYSQKCTHLSCPVYYARERDRIECPCHDGRFSVRTGAVLQGPPPRPLPRIRLERSGDDLVAVGVDVEVE